MCMHDVNDENRKVFSKAINWLFHNTSTYHPGFQHSELVKFFRSFVSPDSEHNNTEDAIVGTPYSARRNDNVNLLAGIEDSSGLRLMGMAEYASLRAEIEAVEAEMSRQEDDIAKHTIIVEENKNQIELIKGDYERLLSHPLLQLNMFCETCVWYNRISCRDRVGYLVDKFKVSRNKAMLMAMEAPSCKKEDR